MVATPSPATAGEPSALGMAAGAVIADRYKLIERLGEGAMGAVWLAEHVHMRKRFAIKVLHAEIGSQELVARFEREAVAAGNINHPGVAAATDFGRLADGSFFLVLEYVAGKDLRHHVHQGALHPARALAITRQILEALAAAHAKGVVHRDIKPENVMLVAQPAGHELEDVVKILDFGIAKLDANAHGDAAANPLTRMGAVYGTPAYMAPEQAMGQPVDARADLYAVGVMLFEMVTGKPPFDGADPIVIIAKQVNEPPPALTSPWAQNAVTLPLMVLVEALLAKTREARPADASAAIALVDAAIAATPGDPRLALVSAPTVFGDVGATGPVPTARVQTFGAKLQTMAFRAKRGAQVFAHDAARKVGIPYRQFVIVASVIGVLVLALVLAIAWPRSKPKADDRPAATAPAASSSAPAPTTPSPPITTVKPWPPATSAAASTTSPASPSVAPSAAPTSKKKPQGGGGGLVGKLKSIFH